MKFIHHFTRPRRPGAAPGPGQVAVHLGGGVRPSSALCEAPAVTDGVFTLLNAEQHVGVEARFMALRPAAPHRVTVSVSTNVHGLHAVCAGFNGRRTLSDTTDTSGNQNPNVVGCVGNDVTSERWWRSSGSPVGVFILEKSPKKTRMLKRFVRFLRTFHQRSRWFFVRFHV